MTNHSTSLKIGSKVPDFSGKNQAGKLISLKDFKEKKLVLYFYPKDDTPGCTAQACNLRDNYFLFKKNGYEIVGVSADDEKAHKKFIEKYELPFPLIADVDHTIIKAYDVWGRKKFMGKEYDGIARTTFVINDKGVLEKIITDVNTKEHTSQIIE
jgi:peroxiredoxin Q/BCP